MCIRDSNYVIDPFLQNNSLYVRAETDDYIEAFNQINKTFESPLILHRENAEKNEIAFITPAIREKEARNAIANLPIDVKALLRVLDY